MKPAFDITPEFKRAVMCVWNSIGHDLIEASRDGDIDNETAVESCLFCGCFGMYCGDPEMNAELDRLCAAYGPNVVLTTVASQISLY